MHCMCISSKLDDVVHSFKFARVPYLFTKIILSNVVTFSDIDLGIVLIYDMTYLFLWQSTLIMSMTLFILQIS